MKKLAFAALAALTLAACTPREERIATGAGLGADRHHEGGPGCQWRQAEAGYGFAHPGAGEGAGRGRSRGPRSRLTEGLR